MRIAACGLKCDWGEQLELKKAVRTAQTYAAPLVDVKAWGQRKLRKARRVPSDSCYRAFEQLPVQAGHQFLDIGANRGQTVDSFRLYERSASVVAFEPNPVLADRLKKRYTNDPAITIHPFGLGSENGHFDLYVPYYRGFMFDGLASFDWESAHGWLNSKRIYGFNERHLKIEQIRCEVRLWDEVETAPDLVKIDVQGLEAIVLRGGLETIREYRPIFLLENNKDRAHEEILFAEGYRRASYEDGRMTMDQLGKKNTYYLPEEKAEAVRAKFI
jgi:FkbM family methyltransferase